MTWLKTDDKFPEHRKVRRLSDPAFRLHVTALCACARDETDGRVTEADIADMEHGARLRKHIEQLVEAGLWEVVRGGWEIHDYLNYNLSHAQLEQGRADARRRQENARERRRQERLAFDAANAGVTGASRRDTSVTHTEVTGVSQHPDPTRPDPTLTVPSRPVVDGSPQASNVTDLRAASHRLTIGGSDGIA